MAWPLEWRDRKHFQFDSASEYTVPTGMFFVVVVVVGLKIWGAV